MTGYLTTEGAREIESVFRRQITEDGWTTSFADWGEMEDYDSEARPLLTHVTYEHLASVRGAHFLVRSRVVAFGVQAANIVLRRLTLHPTEASFRHELDEALARRGGAVAATGTR